ncbi:MAG TPA: hypothetical protein VLW85_22995 [Myxococcales bacterium]|nr:hypothetical protein [Myxococcales bacterium]
MLAFLLAAAIAAEAPAVAVTEFGADAADREKAKGLSGVVASRLAAAHARVIGMDEVAQALKLEKEKQMLGCSDDGCLAEISGALGVRYLVYGRLDRFGKSALLSGFVFDSRAAKGMLRWSQKVDDDAQLPVEADRFAFQAAQALGLQGNIAAPAPDDGVLSPDFSANLKFGNTLNSLHGATLSTFNVRFDAEADYYLSPRWQLFASAGIVVGSASDPTGQTQGSKTFRLFPAFAGAKYTFRGLQALRPYVGAGLGLSLVNKLFDKSDTTGVITQGLFGLAWVPFRHVGFNAEASVNLSSISSDGAGVYFGFNTNFGLLVLL